MPKGPDGETLWARVTATVRPLRRQGPSTARSDFADALGPAPRAPLRRAGAPIPAPVRPNRPEPVGETLDGGWDRRIRRGVVVPDRTIDLHGHTLSTAQAALDHALARALADDVRTLLVVTGKPPRGGDSRRGLIRASIHDWLAHSGHAGRIAAVRTAHPRHGGSGALYLILRRRRE
ncbi:Smr/MutS family protein [Sphingomonas naphthae]|uniref:Smr/MutS family protein n=1 Tax=Sphingomonas naphthae TaxID=1813468 RepID=A0ABY7TLQ9_9SPHN|nr:Smr/MutS family protein [Sphingomonas naphthae]WCT73330.1 Smr/MutS family protein [Sphingomonas naphthae]